MYLFNKTDVYNFLYNKHACRILIIEKEIWNFKIIQMNVLFIFI